MHATPRALAALTLTLGLVTAACGSGSGSQPGSASAGTAGMGPVELIASSPDRVAEAETARVSVTMEMQGAPDATGSFTMEGAVDNRSGDGFFSMDLGDIPGAEDVGLDVSFEVRVVDEVVYMKASGFFGAFLSVPDGVEWLRIDPATMAEDGGLDPQAVLGAGDPGDLTAQFEALRGVSDSVTEVGREEVRGVETTHYEIEIDLDKALAGVPEAQRDAATGAFEMLGVDTFPADVWIDDEGRVVKMEFTFDPAAMGGLEGVAGAADARATMTIEMFDFGVDVDVEPPPADQTADFADAFGDMFGALDDLGADTAA